MFNASGGAGSAVDEVLAGPDSDDAREQTADLQPWIERRKVDMNMTVAAWNLGAGGSSVFSFALKNPAHVAVVDDLAARRCAKTLKIQALGTGAFWCWQNAGA
ncbi:MAG: hypothetical protein U5J62_02120 [Desulfurivibrio sp.]|nr:hypothetical protein [Desulfurivibrio sp.]